MHSRGKIINNQKIFLYEIKKYLKEDFNNSKQELNKIETEDQDVLDAKIQLESKFEQIKIDNELNKFFINEKNIYPKFYAWWDEHSQKVEIFSYEVK
tara:strand:+ start:4023 stop:4313 length:291 start_codon:yes stop_codon:yes gene_type:complete